MHIVSEEARVGVTVSVIIPTWNEAARIEEAVACARAVGDEVVVADGGSPDGTADLAARAGARVVHAPKGRGAQLHAGAVAARGDVLLFLHADTALAPEARGAVLRALEDPRVPGGNFFLRFTPETRLARVYTWLYHVRRRALRIYYGDSAMFVRREVYERLGGFKPLPLLEDYEWMRRLERHGRTAYVREVAAETSTRRFADRPARVMGEWVLIQGLYLLGVPPARLARLYADVRERSSARARRDAKKGRAA
jgi:rSAM/selenodomain-associated transferase 2